MTSRSRIATAFLLLGLAARTTTATADIIAQDSFAYTSGATINAQAGGTGWASAWITGQPTGFVSAAAIAGAPAINQTGGSMQVMASGRVFRAIDLSPTSPAALAGLVQTHSAMFFGSIKGIGAPGTTVWVGMLVSGGTGNPGDETQYHLYDGARTDSTSLAMGDANKDGEVVAMLRGGNVAQWGFERTCNHSTCIGAAASGYFATSPMINFGGTHWSVTRFVFGSTTTAITMWRDPAPGATVPADTSALVLTPFGGGTAVQTVVVPALFFDTIAPNASGNFNYFVDEVRITTTFAELSTGIPGGPLDGGVPPDVAILPDAVSPTDTVALGDTVSPTDTVLPADTFAFADVITPLDATAPSDVLTLNDASSNPDSRGMINGDDSVLTDSATANDATATGDTGASADARTGDGGSGADSGMTGMQPGSCGCSTPAGGPRAPTVVGAMAALAALATRRGRRARARR